MTSAIVFINHDQNCMFAIIRAILISFIAAEKIIVEKSG